jgi:hypothetical protein
MAVALLLELLPGFNGWLSARFRVEPGLRSNEEERSWETHSS